MKEKENFIVVRVHDCNQKGVEKSNSVATLLKSDKGLKKKGVSRVAILVGNKIIMVADVVEVKVSNSRELAFYWNKVNPAWRSRLIFENPIRLTNSIDISDITYPGSNKKNIQTVGYLDEEASRLLLNTVNNMIA